MTVTSVALGAFAGLCGGVIVLRGGRLIIRGINRAFDWIEDRF